MKYLILIILLLPSCITQEKCLERFPPKESVRETIREYYRDSLLPGAIVRDTAYIAGKEVVKNYWYYKTDTSGKAELRWMIDQYGNMIAECTAKDQIIQTLTREVEKEKTTTTPESNGLKWWNYLIMCAGMLLSAWIGKKVF